MEIEKKQIDRIEILKMLNAVLEPWLDDFDTKNRINESTNLLAEVGLDSVAILQLILGIEKQFGVTIKDSELDSDLFSKMNNLIDFIEDKLHEVD